MTLAAPQVTACAGPSLALTKYWGKAPHGINLPATPSLAVTLTPLHSRATVSLTAEQHEVTVNQQVQAQDRYAPFFNAAARLFKHPVGFKAECSNDFPTSAGLASSSSGFAALAVAINELSGQARPASDLSRLARVGSGSAARAVFGGFVAWPAEAEHALQLYDHSYWPELRVIVCVVESGPKVLSSRKAMTRARDSSPYYSAWVQDAAALHQEALDALAAKDLEKLGDIARHSYLRMFGTMLSMSPPLIYWIPTSLELLRLAESLRSQGLGVWETMDAGPQVKYLCQASTVEKIVQCIQDILPSLTILVAQVGAGPCVIQPTTA